MTGAGAGEGAGVRQVLHASAVAHAGRGCLILGAAGSGKTTLALAMVALGAELVADDRVLADAPAEPLPGAAPGDTPIRLAPVPHLAGLVEIRGAGILRLARHAAEAELWLVADLDRAATERMPPRAEAAILGRPFPAIPCRGRAEAAATLMAILGAGRLPDPEYFAARGPQ